MSNFRALVNQFAAAGYDCIPNKKDVKYANGERYPLTHDAWVDCDNTMFRVRSRALTKDGAKCALFIDIDGNKEDAAPVATLLESVGLSYDAMLTTARVQNNATWDSVHFAFLVPVNIAALIAHHKVGLAKNVDLVHNIAVKMSKTHNPVAVDQLPDAPESLVTYLLQNAPARKESVAHPESVATHTNAYGRQQLSRAVEALRQIEATDSDRNNQCSAIITPVVGNVKGGNVTRADAIAAIQPEIERIFSRDNNGDVRALMSKFTSGTVTPTEHHPDLDVAAIFASVETNTKEGNVTARSGYQLLAGSQLVEYFKGCAYVNSIGKIVDGRGILYNVTQFNAAFGGYSFAMDDSNNKVSKKAWEAFTENQAFTFPRVDDFYFDPSEKGGTIKTERGGLRLINSYYPQMIEPVPGDATPFTDLVERMLPDEKDRDILINWMAYKVQNPGALMMWSPVLIGGQGTGKTTLTAIMQNIIGNKYSICVQSRDVDNKFNSWAKERLFASIDELRIARDQDKADAMKTLLTDATIAIQAKGVDSTQCSNHLGVMITSNHHDAVPKTIGDRRYAVFHIPFETEAQIVAAGMDDAYFKNLYDWLNNRDGYAIVAHYLLNRVVAHHPQRAPETTATAAAIQMSMSPGELIVSEAIEDNAPGFQNGIVNSRAVVYKLAGAGIDTRNPRTVANIMRNLGYEQIGGRHNVTNGGKFTAWCKMGYAATYANLSAPLLWERSGVDAAQMLATAAFA